MAKSRILLIEDEKPFARMVKLGLERMGRYRVLVENNSAGGFTAAKRDRPDLVLLDIMMPGMDGIDLRKKLAGNASTAAIPVIFLTGRSRVSDKVSGLAAGVDDYIVKPVALQELSARIDSVLKRRKFYEGISMSDALTGLYNIHYFRKELARFFAMSRRYKGIFSLAILDVDNLKAINDTYGHASGDAVLRKVAAILKRTLRTTDVVTRYGGDEFAVILPHTAGKKAGIAMQRSKYNIKKHIFMTEGRKGRVPVSVCAGIATYRDDVKDEDELFELADASLYRGKALKKHQ